MSKHTPGPWRATKTQDNVVVNQGGDKWIARALIGTKKSPRFICDPDAAAANARLIAAAPDMVAEMIRYLPIIEAAEREPALWERLTAGTGIATANGYRAAIAKAEGK